MDSNEDRVQRLLNDQKRRLLEDSRGVHISQGEVRLPPEAEQDWLEYVSELDRQYSAHRQITVRAFAGYPAVKPFATLTPAELETELDALLEHLLANNIVVHFGRPVSDAEVYRFITEELFEERMDDIRINGMLHTFLYDDVHPDVESEVRSALDDFFMAFFMRDYALLWRMSAHGAAYSVHGGRMTPERLMLAFQRVFDRVMMFTGHCLGEASCEIDGNCAEARCVLSWTGIQRETRRVCGGSGEAVVGFQKNRYSAWDVVRVALPGLMETRASLSR